MPVRSKKVVFVPFCIPCQSAKASGLTKHFPAVVGPLVDLFEEHNVNIVQLPCPEMHGEALVREPHDITYYERGDFIDKCQELARAQADIIEQFVKGDFRIVALLGIERSPSCSLGHVRRRGSVEEGNGVFMREMLEELRGRNIDLFSLSLDLADLEDVLVSLRLRIGEMD